MFIFLPTNYWILTEGEVYLLKEKWDSMQFKYIDNQVRKLTEQEIKNYTFVERYNGNDQRYLYKHFKKYPTENQDSHYIHKITL